MKIYLTLRIITNNFVKNRTGCPILQKTFHLNAYVYLYRICGKNIGSIFSNCALYHINKGINKRLNELRGTLYIILLF